MSIGAALFTSRSEEWGTPQALYEDLDREFHFNLDPCASDLNHKCENYFTKEQDGLAQSWAGHNVYCNPPYGRKISKWIKKAYEEGQHTLVVCLIPARTDTAWFHDYVYGKAEIRFLRGRLKYGDGEVNAPFPSMLVIYRGT